MLNRKKVKSDQDLFVAKPFTGNGKQYNMGDVIGPDEFNAVVLNRLVNARRVVASDDRRFASHPDNPFKDTKPSKEEAPKEPVSQELPDLDKEEAHKEVKPKSKKGK